MSTSLSFLGATGTVTGSRFLLQVRNYRFLFDCGLYQGAPALEQRNWERLPFSPSELTAVILTHAHIDHSGYLPKLVRDGFRGPVYASEATCKLLELLSLTPVTCKRSRRYTRIRRATAGIGRRCHSIRPQRRRRH